MPTIYADAAPLSVAMFNVKELMPVANKVPYMALIVTADTVKAVGSYNHILIASDSAPIIRSEDLGFSEEFEEESITLLVTLEDLTAMEKSCREAAKGTQALLSWSGGTATLVTQKAAKDADPEDVVVIATDYATEENQHHVNTYHELMRMLSVEEAARPYRHAISRGYLSKFDKVKTDSKQHPLSLAIPDEYSPWLVKCGPTFMGMLAPVHEETYEENHGQEGLW